MGRMLSSLAHAVLYGTAVVTGVLALLLMLSVSVEVLARQFFGLSYPLILDFAESSLLVMTFLPAAWVLRQDSHVRIDVFISGLARRRRHFLDAAISLVCAVVMLVVTVVGVNETWKDISLDRIFGGSMVYMRWWMSIFIPIGAGLLTAAYLVRSWESLRQATARSGAAHHEHPDTSPESRGAG